MDDKTLKQKVLEMLTALFILALAAACIVILIVPLVLSFFMDWRFILAYLIYPFLLIGVIQSLATPLEHNEKE